MKTLLVINRLREVLLDVRSQGGNPALFVNLDYGLVQEIKQHAFRTLRVRSFNSNEPPYFASDLLSRNIFNSRLSYCVVKLQELCIPESEHEKFIVHAIERVIERSDARWPRQIGTPSTATSIEDALIHELSLCFEPWYRPDDVFYMDFVKDRQMVIPLADSKKWQITTIGEYFLELRTLPAIEFLLALEAVVGPNREQTRFVSDTAISAAVTSESGEFQKPVPYTLRMLGLVETNADAQTVFLTAFGRRVLERVHSSLPRLRSLVPMLLEAENLGLHVSTEEGPDKLAGSVQSRLLSEDEKKSLKRTQLLFQEGAYLDGLKILYPLLESVLDSCLDGLGENHKAFTGMRRKISRLEERKILSGELSAWLEVVTSRNKVLHGNFTKEDHELSRPLAAFVLRYFNKLLSEIDARGRGDG